MKRVSDLHREAMALADKALETKLHGEVSHAEKLLRNAFEKEREAASFLEEHKELEPSRSVLHRSAASLALECGETREAERLISIALSGTPPDEIAEELRTLFEEIAFHRRLEVRGMTLEADEFQFAMAGAAVGLGIANSTLFIDRVRDIEMMTFRTGERLSGKSFRERGPRERKLEERLELYLSAPQPGSFAVRFKIGRGVQRELPGIGLAQNLIDEVFDCFELFNSAKAELLKQRIQDTSYYKNFVALAKSIAPDGEQIRTIGLTTVRKGAPRKVMLRPLGEIEFAPEPGIPPEEIRKPVKVQGVLRFADARRERQAQIRLVDEKGKSHRIHVPEGMMSDIVRPMWDSEVIVTGPREAGVIVLEDIRKVNK